jgi:hypothetical protein
MRWLSVAWDSMNCPHLSTKVDAAQPSCAVERIVEEAICPLQKAI